MVSPVHSWHLMPKWLLPSTANLLLPQALSKMPCATVMLAGILYSYIFFTATSAYCTI